MLGTDRDALICDLAETYHIFSFDAVPIMTLAALCEGLHGDSRIKMKMAGLTPIDPTFMFVQLADTLTQYVYSMADGAKMPTLFNEIMTGKQKQKDNLKGFDTFEAFEEARKRIIGHE